MYPHYAGSAAWARMLKRRIDRPMNALDEFVRKTFNEWTSTVDKEATRLLEIPLMRRSLDRSGTLDLKL
ncbi:hypothetical protein OS493_038367 [Desmophyllum pertusum]|uniref:Uncharacterized protein n=1 Tax=Desmophyllum pertusum TaxID=174260 RepID=A0A9W9YU62_9CNID|nr:hypothetical protein OS493_038367 [Desmophyllum pertusum]